MAFPVYEHEFADPDEDEAAEEDIDIEDLVAEFWKAVRLISLALGPPHFCGTFEEAGFPDDVIGDPVALWQLPAGRLTLEVQDYEGQEFAPWTLWVMVQPEPEL